MLDAMNTSKIAKNTGLAGVLGDEYSDRTQEELDALMCEQGRQNANNRNIDRRSVWDMFNKDLFDNFEHDTEETGSGAEWKTLLSRDIWVADVEYLGNHKTKSVSTHQNLLDALDLAQEIVDV